MQLNHMYFQLGNIETRTHKTIYPQFCRAMVVYDELAMTYSLMHEPVRLALVLV